jgi:hypothetical protein
VQAYLEHDNYECKSDHIVFETSSGYVLAEWYSVSLPASHQAEDCLNARLIKKQLNGLGLRC